jgi:hypothetical protein
MDKKEKDNISNQPTSHVGTGTKANLTGYPKYPENEDIYNNYQEEKDINPEDISQKKGKNKFGSAWEKNEKSFNDNKSGSDLDVPGSEMDEMQENFGSEDEENNYYSLGGDDHDDLEDDKGE